MADDPERIVEQLRELEAILDNEDTCIQHRLVKKAADEIERLLIQLEEVREVKNGYYEAMAMWRKRAEAKGGDNGQKV
jgi:hypothetical protein